MMFIYRYRIYDDDVGGIINDVKYESFSILLSDVRRDIESYCSDFPDDMDQDPLEKYQEKFWIPNEIYSTLRNFKFQGGLLEWNCWFPGQHRKMIVTFEDKKK